MIAGGTSGSAGGSTTYVLLVTYTDGGFKVCQAARADGANGKLTMSCERLLSRTASPNGSSAKTETLKIVEA